MDKLPNNRTQIKLGPEYRDKLRKLADANMRSMASMVEVLIDMALLPKNNE